jgi:H+-transporting ATPase
MAETVPLSPELSPLERGAIGLTEAEAQRRLAEFGLNTVAEETPSRWCVFLAKFWSPVPWMLEAMIAIQLAIGAHVEAAMVGFQALFNTALGFIQESRADAALAALKKRLAPTRTALAIAAAGTG